MLVTCNEFRHTHTHTFFSLLSPLAPAGGEGRTASGCGGTPGSVVLQRYFGRGYPLHRSAGSTLPVNARWGPCCAPAKLRTAMPRLSRQIQGRWRLCRVMEMNGERFPKDNMASSCGAGRSSQRWRPFEAPSQRYSHRCPTARLVVWAQILDGIAVDQRSSLSTPFLVATAGVLKGSGLFGAAL